MTLRERLATTEVAQVAPAAVAALSDAFNQAYQDLKVME